MVAWCERHCVLGEGDYFGQPIRFQPFQKAFLYRLYELNPDGSRRYRRALLGLPKGNGKTPVAACVAAYELLGGRTSPVIPMGAASFEQADLVFSDLKTMCKESATLRHVCEVYDTEILLKGLPGRAYRVAAAAGTNDGQRPTCFIADELHEWTGNKERVHLVLANGTAKRADSMQLAITTAGFDKDTLLGRLYDYGQAVNAGEIDDPTFLFEWWEAPADCDLSTEKGRRQAVQAANPAAGSFLRVEPILARYHEIPEFEWRRYHLNQWTESNESWLPAGKWADLTVGEFEFDPNEPLYVGVDFALRHDSTAIVVAQWRGESLRVKAKLWEPPLSPTGKPVDDWVTPTIEVENYLRDLHRTMQVDSINYDPAYFLQSAQVLEQEGLPMVEVPQSAARMVPACQATYDLAVHDRIEHNGDPRFARHVAAAVAQQTPAGGWRLVKGKAKAKMDAAIALVLAVSAAVLQEGNGTSVYEERGLVTA